MEKWAGKKEQQFEKSMGKYDCLEWTNFRSQSIR
jgi:hypothetical protein